MSQPNPAEAILGLSTAYWASRCLHLVAEIGVADALGEEPQTAEALAATLGVKADPLGRVLRCLTNHGVFEMMDGRFAHNAASRLLRSDGRPSLRALPRMMGLRMHWDAYGQLEHTLRTGEPGVDRATGEGLFDYFERNPEEGRIFDDAMTSKSFAQIGPALQAYDFSGFGTIGDIGGGAGHLLAAVLDQVPGAKGVLFDLPSVVERAAERPHPRIRYVGGDFFKDAIPACDAYLLMTVLHDWSDAEAAAILAQIKRTAPAGAKLLLLECVVGLTEGFDFGKDLDIEMLVMTTGRERTAEEWTAVLAQGGWRLTRIAPTATGISAVIEAELA
ncbi:MAG: methyltransferase [Caulobacteraceae bacterium]